MANLPSSKKNIRKSLKRRKKNHNILEKIKKAMSKSGTSVSKTQKLIDKAAKEKIIHKNRAADLKSKLAKKGKNA